MTQTFKYNNIIYKWKPLKVLFLAEMPYDSKKNYTAPLMGTEAYKRFLQWVFEIHLDLNTTYLLAPNNVIDLPWIPDHIFFLGERAKKAFLKNKTNFFILSEDGDYRLFGDANFILQNITSSILAHPSTKNRSFNIPGYESQLLENIKEYLYGKPDIF